ncbi:hypothetical protein [Prevotella sp. kh1p2]|uniref:hypothetical protein n=1 Tax=Prevotella sp. kh1p2 TaxID=1761883 RepID=UPI0008B8C567|nr:hypothetical protein [Prevotella sp. kh1p2]SET22281.1 hypothetical protein SAMN04487825_12153 [Prevotella sp. kh1p2]SNU12293.1 hypothetical protein SAMN06298210_12211 [Prevotellaceae bacterium KH2P17]
MIDIGKMWFEMGVRDRVSEQIKQAQKEAEELGKKLDEITGKKYHIRVDVDGDAIDKLHAQLSSLDGLIGLNKAQQQINEAAQNILKTAQALVEAQKQVSNAFSHKK